MNIGCIDFISSYCDRWCERCAYTSRCSAFAAQAAIAMCGDVQEGLELALGTPCPVGAERKVDGADDDPIQNDWNGSAKVALISLGRSEAAWRTIADATNDHTPATLADLLRNLRRLAEDAFPDAWSFIRPGFDEPDR